MDKAAIKKFYKEFPTDDACADHLSHLRWPKVRSCVHCGATKSYEFKTAKLYKCSECSKQFSARSNTIFADSHIPLQDWFLTIQWLVTSKVPVSSIGLSKELDITQKSAWLMLQRIRYARDFDRIYSEPEAPTKESSREQPFKLTGSFHAAMLKLASAPKPASK